MHAPAVSARLLATQTTVPVMTDTDQEIAARVIARLMQIIAEEGVS